MTPRKPKQLRGWIVVASILLLVGAGCATFQYRDVQIDFERAVRIDNGETVSPFTEDNGSAAYQAIIDRLTEEQINNLDDRLKANAWLLRSYSSWRVGDLADARKSANKGLKQGTLRDASRDKVLLLLVPALVVDSETMTTWVGAGRRTSSRNYMDTHEKDFKLAWDKLITAEQQIGEPTPNSTSYYVQYQKWRILQNWRQVIDSFPRGEDTERRAAKDRAKVKVGDALRRTAEKAKDQIPADHTLHKLIEAQQG
jgi:hypothetical protein